jgi:hypothetical protein
VQYARALHEKLPSPWAHRGQHQDDLRKAQSRYYGCIASLFIWVVWVQNIPQRRGSATQSRSFEAQRSVTPTRLPCKSTQSVQTRMARGHTWTGAPGKLHRGATARTTGTKRYCGSCCDQWGHLAGAPDQWAASHLRAVGLPRSTVRLRIVIRVGSVKIVGLMFPGHQRSNVCFVLQRVSIAIRQDLEAMIPTIIQAVATAKDQKQY